jgi:pimeloyl-ACP methyl ester carboxylesterase
MSPSAHAQELPRRPLFGAHIVPSDEGGVMVAALTPGAAAVAAGLEQGDRIVAAAGTPVAAPSAFLTALAAAKTGQPWPLRIERGGETLDVTVTLAEYPRLSSSDYAFEYGAVEAEAALRRTIATVPPGDGPHPAVLLLGGVGCYSLDVPVPTPNPYLLLRDAFTLAGYVTLWVEKSGVGDSEGQPCPEIDFDTEVAGYRAGLDALKARPDVDADRVFLVGHSMGGLIAPLLAAETDVAGLVAVETSGLPWMEYTLANLRRQLPLEGLEPAAVDAAMREALRANYAVFVEGEDPEAVLAEHPEWAGYLAFPQSVSYMRQVAEQDPAAVWLAADAPALLVAGGADFVTDPAEHEHLAAVVNDFRPGSASYVLIDDLDHFLNRMPDQAASFRSLQGGQTFGNYNPELTRVILAWLDEQAERATQTP